MGTTPIPQYHEFHREVRVLGDWRSGVWAIWELGYYEENCNRTDTKACLQLRERRRLVDGWHDLGGGRMILDKRDDERRVKLDRDQGIMIGEEDTGTSGNLRMRWRRKTERRRRSRELEEDEPLDRRRCWQWFCCCC